MSNSRKDCWAGEFGGDFAAGLVEIAAKLKVIPE